MSKEALQRAEERKEVKIKGERERYTQLNPEVQRIARRDKKVFLNEHHKEVEENKQTKKKTETLEISSRKLDISRKHFMQGWAW